MFDGCILCEADFPHDPTENCKQDHDKVMADVKEAVANAVGRPHKEGGK